MYDNVFDNLAINLHEIAVEKGFWPEDVDDIFIAKNQQEFGHRKRIKP